MKRKIFVDLDGVLADFEKAASEKLGTDNIYRFEFMHGGAEFWRRLNEGGDFFATLAPMDDAWELQDALDEVDDVAILTAKPKTNSAKVVRQKKQWVHDNISTEVKVHTCFTKDKPYYCEPGSILIDDRTINRAAWEAKGGILIHHTSAESTITALRAIGVIS